MRFQKNTSIVFCALLLGLFPAFALPVLQGILAIMIVALAVWFRRIDRAAVKQTLNLSNLAFAQFALFFLINAAAFNVLEGNREYYRSIALESWSLTLLCLAILALWLQLNTAKDVKQALMRWLPAGLTISFLVATAVYIWGNQGPRIEIFATGPLAPPFWFLVLTLCSFAWFSEMSRPHKIWRLALLFMAGVMVIYGSARLVMLAWLFSGMILAVWLYLGAAAEQRKRVLLAAGLCVLLGIGGVFLVDFLAGGRLRMRIAVFSQGDFTFQSLSDRFVRIKIWSSALTIFAQNPWFGVGQINEYVALQKELDWSKWFRAHQTYLSYLIAGGIPALVSGLIMQSPVLAFVTSAKRSALFPAFLGLGVVVTLNCMTDSIFQSAVNVQIFMAATLIFLRAGGADHGAASGSGAT